VESDPKNVKLRFELASALTYAKRTKEAHEHIDQIFAQNVNDPSLLQNIGVVLSESGDDEKAAEAYRLSLKAKENPAAHLGLAGIFTKNGNFDAAAEAYSKVISLKPDTPNIMKVYADLLRDNGRRREALEMYRRSLSLLPTNGPALLEAGILSLKLGDKEAANMYLATLKSVDPELARRLARCIALDPWR
jgi:tetratricopeptide (TPR) repeat protein